MQVPLSVGQSAAIAGRSMPGSILRLNFAIAISAPVLPADTATSASPFLTASMASHIDDFQRPLRSAWLGLSSIRTATSVCTSRQARLEPRMGGEQRVDPGLVAEQDELAVGMLRQRQAAPGTTTEGPWSPPMASSAMRTFWGMDRPEHRRWDAGNSVFGSDRVKIDNSLPAGGRTSGNHLRPFRHVWNSAELNGLWGLLRAFFSAASAANGWLAGSPAGGASNTAPGLRG